MKAAVGQVGSISNSENGQGAEALDFNQARRNGKKTK
jgi:hypothetical protein